MYTRVPASLQFLESLNMSVEMNSDAFVTTLFSTNESVPPPAMPPPNLTTPHFDCEEYPHAWDDLRELTPHPVDLNPDNTPISEKDFPDVIYDQVLNAVGNTPIEDVVMGCGAMGRPQVKKWRPKKLKENGNAIVIDVSKGEFPSKKIVQRKRKRQRMISNIVTRNILRKIVLDEIPLTLRGESLISHHEKKMITNISAVNPCFAAPKGNYGGKIRRFSYYDLQCVLE